MVEKLRLVWGGMTQADLEARKKKILELWALGFTYDQIGERVDLTGKRVGQIIRGVR